MKQVTVSKIDMFTACQKPFTMFLIFLLCVMVRGEINIVDQGIGPVEADDIALIFYITVKNVCKDNLDISVNMIRCCETISSEETDCNSIFLIGGDMGVLYSGKIKNYTLIYTNLYLNDRRGICTVAVSYRNDLKRREVIIDIPFDSSEECNKKSEKTSCESPDLDHLQNCNPVDCLIKYSGGMSYFNPNCKRCQRVPACNPKSDECNNPDVAYSPYANDCIDLNNRVCKHDLVEIGKNRSKSSAVPFLNSICHLGEVTDAGDCRCFDGWSSYLTEEGIYEPNVAQRHLCNIQIGDWNCINKNKVRVTALLIAIFALTIITKVLLLVCVLNWCYRHFRKKNQVCGDQIDPDHDSIILCENIGSFDKCLCSEGSIPNRKCLCSDGSIVRNSSNKIKSGSKTNQQKSLAPQTVNVSYYPVSAGIYSSSDYTTQSDQTIEFSGTTQSSQSISFEDEQEPLDQFEKDVEEDLEDEEIFFEEETDNTECSTDNHGIFICNDEDDNHSCYSKDCSVKHPP